MCILSVEEKIVFLLSRPNLTEEDLDLEIATLNTQCGAIDCNKIFEIAVQNDVVPLLYKNSKGANIFSAQFESHLQLFYSKTLSVNRSKSEELLQIINLLQGEGIEVIPLKGSFASETIFNDLGVYHSGDIDILVKKSRLRDVGRILVSIAGYSKVSEYSSSDLLASHYHVLYRKNDCLLEVHWKLSKRYFKIPANFWWHETRLVEWQGRETIELAIEKYLLYTIFRLFDHNFVPLRFFVLIAGIINKYQNEINWENLLGYSKQYRMERLVVFTLILVHELLAVQIPIYIKQKKPFGYNLIKHTVHTGLLRGIERQHFRMMLYVFLLDGPFETIKALLGRLFPTKGELRLRYNLPNNSQMVYLYYVLNPILLFMKNRK